MKIFGQADKPKKYQESVKAEASRVEAAREKALKQFEATEIALAAKAEEENRSFKELQALHKAELHAVILEKRNAEHQIKEASSGFKATQSRLNTLEGSLKARERAVLLAERDAQERVADAHRLEEQTKALVKERREDLASAKETSAQMIKKAEERLNEASKVSERAAKDAESAQKAYSYAERLIADANMQMKRVQALEDNLALRERELERKAKKLQSKEASLAAYEQSRR